MTTRFMCKVLPVAALGIALSLVLAAPTTTSAASSSASDILLDPPEAPSNCRIGHFRIRDRREGDYILYYVSWRDNSDDEDGFTCETWWRDPTGQWVLLYSQGLAANSTRTGIGGRPGSDYRFRVKAFNASGDSAWSDWAR